MNATPQIVEIKHGHFFCGVGGGAKGFNRGQARVGNLTAKFRCVGGIDNDPGAIAAFSRMAGVAGTVLDLFSREQYVAFHGKEPPADWREATLDDVRRAFHGECPDIFFLSAPCKGFSGLLAEAQSKTDKYQALNGLTLRGVFLMLEAFKDQPPKLIVFENVPRIANRGRHLLDQIVALLRSYGYDIAETTHDCGEIGGLAQSRKRFLLVARHRAQVPPFLYQPEKRRLRGVGEVLDKLPLPGDPLGGPMHRMPALQWKTWVRLAFVEAGSDWRSLNKLSVADGVLTDFGIVPDYSMQNGTFGVQRWTDPSGVITSRGLPTNGNFAVADPRPIDELNGGSYGVKKMSEPGGVVTSQRSPGQGAFSVADPRIDGHEKSVQHGVRKWDETAGVVTGKMFVGGGPHSVADPRPGYGPKTQANVFRIVQWDAPAGAVTSANHVTGAAPSVADPRFGWDEDATHPSKLKVQGWDETAGTVSGARFLSGMGAVADPRPGKPSEELHGKFHVTPFDEPARAVIGGRENGAYVVADPRPTDPGGYKQTKYRVTAMEEASGAVIAASTTGNGAFAVADPRPLREPHDGNSGVLEWDEHAGTVQGASLPSNGAFAVADPRSGLDPDREAYKTGGHYGVVPWDQNSRAVPGFAKHDRGPFSVADPREADKHSVQINGNVNAIIELPKADQRLVCIIRARDNTWHRPFTTLELGALQSFVDPDDIGSFWLPGQSNSAFREWIGNAVPPDAAEAIAGVMGTTLLLAMTGETFMLSAQPIWVQPIAMALAIDQSPNEGLLD